MRAAHREYGVSVPSRPASFARFGHRAGWPSYSHRPASVDMLETRSPAGSALSRENRDPPAKPAGASASRRLEWRYRPRLIGWSSLHLAHPYLWHPSSSSRAPPDGLHGPPGSLREARLATHASFLNPRNLDRLSAAPFSDVRAAIGMPSVVSRWAGLPRPSVMHARLVWRAHTSFAPFSPWSRRGVRQHVIRSAPRPAPLHLARLAAPHVIRTRDASDRLLPSHFFVPVPAPRRFSMRRGRFSGTRSSRWLPDARQRNSRFGGSHVPFLGGAFHRGGRYLPAAMRAYRASDTPVASLVMP